MSYQVRYTKAAKDDIVRLYGFLIEQDISAARKALDVIQKGIEFLQDFPFTCRKATPEDPLLREMIIEDNKTITILAVRHQREEDYH